MKQVRPILTPSGDYFARHGESLIGADHGLAWMMHAHPSIEREGAICLYLRDGTVFRGAACVSLTQADVRALIQLLTDAAAEAQLALEEAAPC